MKNTILKAVEKTIKYVSENSFESASAWACYEEKINPELKQAILAKKNIQK